MTHIKKHLLNKLFIYKGIGVFALFIILSIIWNSYIFYSFTSSSIHKSFKTNTVSNIVWIFWDGEIGKNIRFFLHDLKQKLNSYNIIYICNSTIYNYINKYDLPYGLYKLPVANQVDFYKFYLCYNYGGVWMDASTYISNETFINNFTQRVRDHEALLGAFNYKFHPNYHIEAGFLISPRYSPFVRGILNEIFICLKMGRKKYINKRIDEGIIIKSYKIIKYKNEKRIVMPYLYVYVCILTVLQRNYHNVANLELLKAEDYMYKLLSYCHGYMDCIKQQWEEVDEVRSYPIIKFNNFNRDILNLPETFVI